MRLELLFILLLLPGVAKAHILDRQDEAAQIQAVAEELLTDRFPEMAHRLDVRVLRTRVALEDPATLRLIFPAEGAIPRGHTQVDVHARAEAGDWQKVGWALLYVAHFDSVATIRRRVQPGEAVTDADVTTIWIETTTFHGNPMRAVTFQRLLRETPLYASRLLREGRTLHRDDLRPPYAADTGETVEMHYQRGPVLLRLPCKAREPGFEGDVIRLYAPTTSTTYRARLTGPGKAEWIETR